MSNQVQLSNQAFVFNSNQIRVYGTYENPLFCLADVCKILQLTSPNKTANQIKEEFEGEELNSYPLQTKGGVQKLTFITEPQLYFVMMRSRAKTAKSFRQWICNEVIPTIRKTGSYSTTKLNDDVNALKNHMYIKYKLICLSADRVRDVVLFEEMRNDPKIKANLHEIVEILRKIHHESEHAKNIMFLLHCLDVGFSCLKSDYGHQEDIDNHYKQRKEKFYQSYRAASLWS